MSIHVCLTHVTEYLYDRAITLSPQVVRLRPAPHSRTPIPSYSLKVDPAGHFLNWQQDPQGNWLARLVFPEKTKLFRVTVDLVADMSVTNPFDFFLEPAAETLPLNYDPDLAHELAPFRLREKPGPLLADYLTKIPRDETRTVDFLVGLNLALRERVGYVIRLEPGVQDPETTLERSTGSCRDSAWLLVRILRELGFAARFVSGYLIQLVPDQKPLDGPAGPPADFTDLHAWAEVYLPGAGWIGLDATSGLFTGEGHIPLACSPDPTSAAPITGMVEKCEVEFRHEMTVRRVFETPRVTKPHTDEQWKAIDALGRIVDARLKAGDTRLTMGGEPTFVSIDDMDGEEWNTAAVGPTKRARAHDLLMRLRERFAPGGLVTFGQGKWYPGESLPRWAFALHWRGDGKPLWNDASLVASETENYSPTADSARVFVETLAERLDVDKAFALPAFEDPIHYSLREWSLPPNVDPFDAKLEDAEERERLARVVSKGLSTLVGYTLPLQRWNAADGRRWVTGPWPTRRGRICLSPGDSAMGLRLPLGSLPWIPAADYPYVFETDPFAPRGPLPVPERRQAFIAGRAEPSSGKGGQGRAGPIKPKETKRGLIADGVRTALCVEPRDGRICVFLPPLERVDDFIELVAAIEDAAEATDTPVHLEGYPPPSDPRINVIKVTPDPGVIEVNIHPSSDWESLRDTTLALYEEARASRLGAEKFMLDGRHVGTGGGNHIVVGGATPADSPFLRRPDLLGSLIRYWVNHPSLSYLFSGLFIGPTSQAPRLDEARDDAVYELRIALDQLPPPDRKVSPWLVDRALRNLLVDVTGNTHRAEICIDKLYSPDSASGRLGLVEFRGFEMPPHARMSLAQQLLLRGLIAAFWERPYTVSPVRWGNALHDKFMLPHFVWGDFLDVIADLRGRDLPFESDWFLPHFEFRFPVVGSIVRDGVELELRTALEPWHVLGEEPGGGGTARFVDSSLERLQVRVSNLTGGRYRITCAGRDVPLVPTGRPGEFVAGVRFRAWRPPSCLHPTIGVHTPLVFDIIDDWNGRSIGGCVHHVAHPGGRNYQTFPVNAFEAEARRRARFFDHGHTGGFPPRVPSTIDPDFPTTLDLRRT